MREAKNWSGFDKRQPLVLYESGFTGEGDARLSSMSLTERALNKQNQSLGKGFHFHREQGQSGGWRKMGP